MRIQYEIDPDSRPKTARNALCATAKLFLFELPLIIGSFAAVLNLLTAFVDLFGKAAYTDYCLACLYMTGLLAAFFIPEFIKAPDKGEFLIAAFINGVVITAGAAIPLFIAMFSHKDPWAIAVLLLSICLFALFFFLKTICRRAESGQTLALFTRKECAPSSMPSASPVTADYQYCHRCGKKLLKNSRFCAYCGTAIPFK